MHKLLRSLDLHFEVLDLVKRILKLAQKNIIIRRWRAAESDRDGTVLCPVVVGGIGCERHVNQDRKFLSKSRMSTPCLPK